MVTGRTARLFFSSRIPQTGRITRSGAGGYRIVLAAVAMVACFPAAPEAVAQRAKLNSGPSSHLSDGPNPVHETDLAAGQLLDSIFDPDAPENPLPAVVGQMLGRVPTRGAARRSSLRGRLIRNPDTADGSPPFVIVDRYGGIQRYIEPVSSVDLEAFEGRIVGVRRDTGDTLLASQLDLPRNANRSNPPGLQLAGHEESIGQELIEPGEIMDEQPLIMPEGVDPVYLDDGLDFGECLDCGQYSCRSGCNRGIRGRTYVRGEYLLWWLNGFDTPPLVTASDPLDGGVLPNEGIVPNDNPSTRILYGGDELLDGSRSGGRIRLGTWFRGGRWALEGDYFALGSETETFSASGYEATNGYNGDGSFLSRPFFDFRPSNPGPSPYDGPQENAENVYSDTIEGSVTVLSKSDFQSAAILLRRNICCAEARGTACGDCVDCSTGVGCGDAVGAGSWCELCGILDRGTRHIDFLVGLRYAQLDDSLGILEDLEAYVAVPPVPEGTTFDVNDHFATSNDFVGGELGFHWQWQHRRWSLDLLSKLAIGTTRQKVSIRGSTIQDGQTNDPGTGGMLALTSNIGQYQRDQFSVLPELGLTLGYQLTQRLRVTTGYTLLYWSNVVRPGDQIDREINSTLLPPDTDDIVIPQRPHFVYRNSNLWAQGIHLGAEYRW